MLPSKTHLGVAQFVNALDAQYKLNNEYSGSNGPSDTWRKDPSYLHRFAAASDTEMTEFLNEITADWKWYEKPDRKTNNREAALFELIDVMHFSLAGLLKAATAHFSIEEIGDRVMIQCKDFFADRDLMGTSYHESGVQADFYGQMMHQYRRFWAHAYQMWTAHQGTPKSQLGADITRMTVELVNFLGIAAGYLGYTADEVYQAYMLKNKRNQERVAKGVMKGVDVKATEEALCLTPA